MGSCFSNSILFDLAPIFAPGPEVSAIALSLDVEGSQHELGLCFPSVFLDQNGTKFWLSANIYCSFIPLPDSKIPLLHPCLFLFFLSFFSVFTVLLQCFRRVVRSGVSSRPAIVTRNPTFFSSQRLCLSCSNILIGPFALYSCFQAVLFFIILLF